MKTTDLVTNPDEPDEQESVCGMGDAREQIERSRSSLARGGPQEKRGDRMTHTEHAHWGEYARAAAAKVAVSRALGKAPDDSRLE
jgi:hypothetical protein